MNIFVLHADPVIAAQMQCDRHVVKMILETAQLLSTAHRVLDGVEVRNPKKSLKLTNDIMDGVLYKATHINHPSAVWTRDNRANYDWLYGHFIALLDEYTFRYGRVHASAKLKPFLASYPKNMHTGRPSKIEFSVAMKNEYKVGSTPIEMYLHYYRATKMGFARWTKRVIPLEFIDYIPVKHFGRV
ncbi:MAG: hypothetical protein DDT26_00786 [Dehalococcoidia bacterium]|nr:hypothetical protein [Chloroflexota bacterium]